MTVNILFYVFAGLSILGAWLVVSARNPVRAVIAKVFTFFAAAAVWITMQQAYLALLLIVVYVGAVLVMFLFVVMMIDIDTVTRHKKLVFYWPLVIVLCAALAALIAIIVESTFKGALLNGGQGTVYALGKTLFSDPYLYAVELAAMILLAAMVAAITLTFRGKRAGNKSPNPSEQLKASAADRLTMIKMPSEKKADQGDKS